MDYKKLSTGLLLILNMFFVTNASAFHGVTVSGGGWNGDSDRLGGRLAVRWEWQENLYENNWLEIGGYWEPSIGYWHADDAQRNENDTLWIFAVSPVFQFRPVGAMSETYSPFLELGIGASLMTQDDLGGRELGSTYHFEDRVGIGMRFNCDLSYELSYRYFHYSNASIESPNSGLDLHTINFTVIW